MWKGKWEVLGKEQRSREKMYAKYEKNKEKEKRGKEVGYKRRWWRKGKGEHKMSRTATDSVGSSRLQAKHRDHKMIYKCESTLLPTLLTNKHQLTNLLTRAIHAVECTSWEVKRYSAGQTFPRIIWIQGFTCMFATGCSSLFPVHVSPFFFINFNIILRFWLCLPCEFFLSEFQTRFLHYLLSIHTYAYTAHFGFFDLNTLTKFGEE
jgi:hypothetical protein